MVVITFGWCLPAISFKHEFGHQSYKKMLAINLIFTTVFITQKNSKLYSFLWTYAQNDGAEGVPQYREQIKKIKSKARKQAEADCKQQMLWIERDRDRYYKDYTDLKNKVSGLKNLAYQVRNIKAMSEEDFKKYLNYLKICVDLVLAHIVIYTHCRKAITPILLVY